MRTLERRYAALQASWQARADRLVGEVRERIPMLAAEAGAHEVWLFGSLAWGTPFEDSDVDLAVAGLDGAAFDAFATAAFMAIGAPVDVVRLEDAPATLRERILTSGLSVYRSAPR